MDGMQLREAEPTGVSLRTQVQMPMHGEFSFLHRNCVLRSPLWVASLDSMARLCVMFKEMLFTDLWCFVQATVIASSCVSSFWCWIGNMCLYSLDGAGPWVHFGANCGGGCSCDHTVRIAFVIHLKTLCISCMDSPGMTISIVRLRRNLLFFKKEDVLPISASIIAYC